MKSGNGGLTREEPAAMDDLVSAWNKFVKLEKQHPSDISEFQEGITNFKAYWQYAH